MNAFSIFRNLVIGAVSLTISPFPKAQALPEGAYEGNVLRAKDIMNCAPLNSCPDKRKVELGRKIFFDKGLSGSGRISCATCHSPEHGWSASKAISEKFQKLPRSIPSVQNLAYQRWFFWDGRQDTLALQPLEPLENPREMDGHRLMLFSALASRYSAEVGSMESTSKTKRIRQKELDRRTKCTDSKQCGISWTALSSTEKREIEAWVTLGLEALAAFQLSLRTEPTRFDRYAVASPDKRKNILNESEVRGLNLFFGKAKCVTCHNGKGFTDGEFHNLMLPSPLFRPKEDSGRYSAIEILLKARDSKELLAGGKTSLAQFLKLDGTTWGQFRTPSLRNLKGKVEFMHNGSMKSKREVLNYYNTLSSAVVVSHHSNPLIAPLQLSSAEIDDLESFVNILAE